MHKRDYLDFRYWIAIFVLAVCAISGFNIFVAAWEARLNAPIILSNPNKQLVVVASKNSSKMLQYYGVSFKKIIESATLLFKNENLPIEFNNSFSVEYTEEAIPFRYGKSWGGRISKSYYEKSVRKLLSDLNIQNQPKDQVVIILSDQIPAGYAMALRERFNGDGVIVMGVGVYSIFEFAAKEYECWILGCYQRGSSQVYTRLFSCILAHEEAHLYGVGHIRDKNSIMSEHSRNMVSGYCQFDFQSTGKLKRAIQKLIL